MTKKSAPRTVTSNTKIPPVTMTGDELQALAARLNRMAGIVNSMAAEGGEITTPEEAEQYRTFARVGVAECERIQDSVGRAIHDAKQAMFAYDQAYDTAQDLQSAIRGQVAERLRAWEEQQNAPTEPPPACLFTDAWQTLTAPEPPEPTAVDLAPVYGDEDLGYGVIDPDTGLVSAPAGLGVSVAELDRARATAPDLTEWGIEHVTLSMVPPAYLRPDGSLDVRQAQRDHYDLGLAIPGVTFRPGTTCIV